NKVIASQHFVVCAVGLRAEESSARARKPRYQVRNDIASVWYKTPATHRTADEKEQWAEQAYHNWLKAGKKGRFALSWHPIHHWSLEDVWQTNGTFCKDVTRRVCLYQSGSIKEALSDFPCHWAYVAGNTRLSCALCVLGSHHDILNGAHHNPWTWAELALMEVTSGWSFQQSRWLASLSSEVLSSSLAKRQQLFKTLRHLGLVRSVGSLFLLSLMCSCELAQLLFWTDKAVLAIARLVSKHLPAL
ncbi:MAG: phosphoadenosine phosphosulfate reductase family protein, partial [Cyanobacteria bacterium J06576_12]